MRKGIGIFHCFGDAPIDRSLPRVKRTQVVGYELFAQLIRNRITDCLVYDRSDVDEGERSGEQLRVIVERVTLALPVAYDTAGVLATTRNRKQRDRKSCTICHYGSCGEMLCALLL